MKKLILISALLLVGWALKAQDTFFPTKEGTVLVYKTFDKKDKLTNTLRYTIREVKKNGSDMDITYLCESIDPKDKPVFSEEITIHQKGDKLYFDMSNFVSKAAFVQEGQVSPDIQVKGNELQIPLNPAPGDALPDANVEMSLKMGFINMKSMAELTNRKVEAVEDVTVKAGTFNAYRLSCDVNASAMGIKTKAKSVDWYAKGIGTIKTESFDKNGQRQSYMELIEVR
ncbi:MAG TPA: hypothetical protein VFG54_22250 [Prolixibacteraceae bacterium]|nr:hypothetical protein [Prolixibacteraceae bacterium]